MIQYKKRSTLWNQQLFILKPKIRATFYALIIFSHLENLYYGPKLNLGDDPFPLEFKQMNILGTTTIYDEGIDPAYSLEHINLELATYGKGDYRPASLVLNTDLGIY